MSCLYSLIICIWKTCIHHVYLNSHPYLYNVWFVYGYRVCLFTFLSTESITNVTVNVSNTELVELSSVVRLVCLASGSSLSFRWVNGSSEVLQGVGVLLEDGNRTLTIQNVTRFDVGPFSCHVANALDNATSHPISLIISCEYTNLEIAKVLLSLHFVHSPCS